MLSAKERIISGKAGRQVVSAHDPKFGSPEHLATLSPAEAADVIAKLASMTSSTTAPKGVGGRAGLRARRASISAATVEGDDQEKNPVRTVSEEQMTSPETRQKVGTKGGWRAARRVLAVARFALPKKTQNVVGSPDPSVDLGPVGYGLAGVLRYVKAVVDCEPSGPSMLALKKDDVIAVTHEDDNGSGWLGGVTIIGGGGDGRWFSKHQVRRIKLETTDVDGSTRPVSGGLIVGKVKEAFEAYVAPPEQEVEDNVTEDVASAVPAAAPPASKVAAGRGGGTGGCCASRPVGEASQPMAEAARTAMTTTNGPDEGVPPPRLTKEELEATMEAARASTAPSSRSVTPPRRL